MRIILALLFLVPLVPMAAADPHGDCWVNSIALGEIEIGDSTAAHTVYVDDRNYVQGDGTWIYAESNGIFAAHAPGDQRFVHENLQRGGSSMIIPNDNENCYDETTNGPDTLVM